MVVTRAERRSPAIGDDAARLAQAEPGRGEVVGGVVQDRAAPNAEELLFHSRNLVDHARADLDHGIELPGDDARHHERLRAQLEGAAADRRCVDQLGEQFGRRPRGKLLCFQCGVSGKDGLLEPLQPRARLHAELVPELGTEPLKSLQGAADVASHDLTGSTLVVIGNETSGLSEAWRNACDTIVRIPISGSASSLNAASAATVLLYEAARQRAGRNG